MSELTTDPPETIAAIDLGSNSFHLIVARTGSGEPVVVDRLREMVQLAAGLDRRRRLDDEAQRRALECLARFGERVRHLPADAVRAVGTNTLRSAHGIDGFVADAEAALGHPIETISGVEEARLIYVGVTRSLAASDARRLVIDIGGGSTELVLGRGAEPERLESLYVGCVTLSRSRFADGRLTRGAWRKARLAAMQELEPVATRFREAGWDEAIGASGTIRAAGRVLAENGWSPPGQITAKGLRRLRDALLEVGDVERLSLAGLSTRRRAVFPGGAVLLDAIVEALGIDALRPADGALREGLLDDLLGRTRDADVRDASVRRLGTRYHVDVEHAARVRSTARDLLDRVSATWHLGDRPAARLLDWAAELHEIGLDIAHQHYNRHGEYILAQSDLPGFSREEQRRLAALVRAHRHKLPLPELHAARGGSKRRLERLAILLRLAVLLHRSRRPLPPPRLELRVAKRSLRVGFPAGWLDEHALTRADLEQEAAYLSAAGYSLEFG